MKKITFTVSETEKELIEAVAGGNLTQYCRDIILRETSVQADLDAVLDRVVRIERKVDDIAESKPASAASGGEALPVEVVSAIFETLYLFRLISKPDAKDTAKAEIERIGLPYIYSSDMREKYGKG